MSQTQKMPYNVLFTQWTDSAAYAHSPEPFITGEGEYSDSLSKLYNGQTFFEYHGDYYCINSWADYYYWYTKKYSHYFKDPLLYEFYYWSQNELEMVRYIASYSYKGRIYPSYITLGFEEETNVLINRMGSNKYLASNEKQIKKIKKLAKKQKKMPVQEKYTQEKETYYNFNKKPVNVSSRVSTKNLSSKTTNRQIINKSSDNSKTSNSSNKLKSAASKEKIKK